MSIALVTGATGLVGYNIVQALRDRGRSVRVLVRSLDKARSVMQSGVELAEGDVTNPASIESAIAGCDVVFHAAGLPEQWLPDSATFHRINAEGTENMLRAALAAKVRRFVHTSTIDVFQAARGESYDESVLDPEPKGTAYERSKQEADRAVVRAIEEHGLDAVFLHPSAVYGPGPAASPGLNEFLRKLRDQEVPALPPGGMPVVFAADVGEGHVRAEERAERGARYILSDRYVTNRELAEEALRQLGRSRVPISVPLAAAKIFAAVGEGVSSLTKKPPLVAKGQVHFLDWGAHPKHDRAERELDMRFVGIVEGVKQTLEFLAS